MIGAILLRHAVRSGYRALNTGELDKFMSAWADQSVWIYPGNLSVSGKFVGKERVRNWFEHFHQQFPQMQFTLKHLGIGNIFAFGGNNTVTACWELESINKEGSKYNNRGITLMKIKDSKIVSGEDFLFKSDGEDFTKLWGE